MLCFQVLLNGKLICTAGVDDLGVLTAILTYVRRDAEKRPQGLDDTQWEEELDLSVSGSHTDHEYLHWISRANLSIGDEIHIKIIDRPICDPPTTIKRDTPEQVKDMKRKYYERIRSELKEYEESGEV